VTHLRRAVVSTFLRNLGAAGAVGFVLCMWPAIVLADRQLPTDATLAKSATFSYPNLTASGKTLRISVGARIYDQNNRIIMPVAVPAKVNVLFKTDMNGDVSRVWIITDQEAAAYKKK
jgi:hypothetical protein